RQNFFAAVKNKDWDTAVGLIDAELLHAVVEPPKRERGRPKDPATPFKNLSCLNAAVDLDRIIFLWKVHKEKHERDEAIGIAARRHGIARKRLENYLKNRGRKKRRRRTNSSN